MVKCFRKGGSATRGVCLCVAGGCTQAAQVRCPQCCGFWEFKLWSSQPWCPLPEAKFTFSQRLIYNKTVVSKAELPPCCRWALKPQTGTRSSLIRRTASLSEEQLATGPSDHVQRTTDKYYYQKEIVKAMLITPHTAVPRTQ